MATGGHSLKHLPLRRNKQRPCEMPEDAGRVVVHVMDNVARIPNDHISILHGFPIDEVIQMGLNTGRRGILAFS